MALSFTLPLHHEIVVLSLLQHNAQDDTFKVFEADSHIQLTQFLQSILKLRISHIFVHYALIARH